MGAPEGCKQHGCVWAHLLVGTGKAISVLFGINGVRNQRSHLVGPPFPVFKSVVFRLRQVGISRETYLGIC